MSAVIIVWFQHEPVSVLTDDINQIINLAGYAPGPGNMPPKDLDFFSRKQSLIPGIAEDRKARFFVGQFGPERIDQAHATIGISAR